MWDAGAPSRSVTGNAALSRTVVPGGPVPPPVADGAWDPVGLRGRWRHSGGPV